MRCVNCGEPVRDPVWATYADAAFADRPGLEAFPLHQKCFDRDETVAVSEWVDDTDHADYSDENRVMTLKHSRAKRYRKAQAP